MKLTTLTEFLKKYEQAQLKHSWQGYTPDDMLDALDGEWCELIQAHDSSDVHGPHGVYAEALDVAVVALRIAEHYAPEVTA
jgi:hypothetical protein